MIEVYVPKTATVFRGLRVPEGFEKADNFVKFVQAMNELAGNGWDIVKEEGEEARVRVERPWGFVDAFVGDYVITGVNGMEVSVLPPVVFNSLRLKTITFREGTS